jgi:hypothetical protein
VSGNIHRNVVRVDEIVGVDKTDKLAARKRESANDGRRGNILLPTPLPLEASLR